MNIAFIGGGNMASALIGGLLAKGHPKGEISVIEVLPEAREKLARQFGVRTVEGPQQLGAGTDAVVLAVKPQQMRTAVAALAPHLGDALVLSIAAGIRLGDIARWIGRPASLVRAMPNTPALIGLGITGVFAASALTENQRSLVDRILGVAGKIVWVRNEAELDPVTAVSGSGPAYVFYFIEALTAAGIALGLEQAVAAQLALETFRGAAELAARSPEDPAQLRARVTSRGGTTEQALAVLEERQVRAAIESAARAASRRAGELADEFGRTP